MCINISSEYPLRIYKMIANTYVYCRSKPIQYHEKMRPGQAQMICASFSPGGAFMAAGSADHNVRVYAMLGDEGPRRVLEIEAHTDTVDSIQWAHNGLKFISGSKDGTANVWHFEQQQWLHKQLLMTTKLTGYVCQNKFLSLFLTAELIRNYTFETCNQ